VAEEALEGHGPGQAFTLPHSTSPAVEAFDWEARDYAPIIQERIRRLNAIRDQTPFKELDDDSVITAGAVRLYALKLYYKTHPIDFVQDWVTTFDPRELGEGKTPYMPFVLFPRQREFISWLYERWRNQEDGCAEKSRDMGISWLCIDFALWMWLFHPGSKANFGSYKAEKVDQLGNQDSLFEKGRILLRNLPHEFLPSGFNEDDHCAYMKFINPENGASVTGEAGDQIGRGGRCSIYFIDEAAFLERPDRAEAALSQTTKCRIWASTANGMGNPFYRKVMSGSFPVFRFHWTQDPRKDREWYEEQKGKLEPHILASEVDIDYTASVERIVIPQRWVQSAVKINRMVDWPKYHGGIAGLDIGGSGSGKSVYVARFGPFVDPCEVWQDADPNLSAMLALEKAKEDEVDAIHFDMIGVGEGTASTFNREKMWEIAKIESDNPIDAPRRVFAYLNVVPINVGGDATDAIWPDDRRSVEKFANLRAELWWIMRDRFLKTHEHVLFLEGKEGGVAHRLDELIVMPDDPILQAQLSAPTWDPTNKGKILIEAKKSMRTRGVPSPDYADALALTFAPDTLGGDFGVSDLAGLV
jgi:hypothetical protein